MQFITLVFESNISVVGCSINYDMIGKYKANNNNEIKKNIRKNKRMNLR